MRVDIKEVAKKRWRSLLISIGMETKLFNGHHAPCLYCGGKDRARWNREKEIYFCSQCGIIQPVDMAMRFLNLSFKEAAAILKKNMGGTMTDKYETNYKKNEEAIKKIFSKVKRIRADSPVDRYLTKRGIKVRPEIDCYQHDSVNYWSDGKSKGKYPAMISVFRTPVGEVCTLHITYLDESGDKASVEYSRKMMPVMNPLVGSACRLWTPGKILCVTEGIETALSVHQLEGFPTWSLGNAHNVEYFIPPDICESLFIFADEDVSATGTRSAYILQNKLKLAGKLKTVCVVRYIGGEIIYDYGGVDEGQRNYDWNDRLREHG